MLKRPLVLVIALLIIAGVPGAAQTQPATPEISSVVASHAAWVESLFAGAADDLTIEDIEARFDDNFLRLVPPAELIGTVQQLADTLGPLEFISELPARNNEFVGVYRADSGDGVMISLAIDSDSGLIAGFFITPAPLQARAATPATSPEASPAASPVAGSLVIGGPGA